MNAILYIVVALGLYLLWVPTVRRGLNRLSCQRSFSREAVFAGEEVELVEIIRNDSPYLIPWLRLESRISPHLRLGQQENMDVSGQMYYCSLFAPMPRQQIRRRHRVQCLHRGFFDLGSASLTAGDLLDTVRFHRAQDLSASILVYPRLLEDDRLPYPLSTLVGELSSRRMLLTDPFLFRGIRPYQPGDPVRDIHWPATARMSQAQLRLHDPSTSVRLLVVLNGQYESLQWKPRLSESHLPILEDGISLAATMCCKALEASLEAGFATNLSAAGTEEPTLLLPAEDSGQQELLLDAFARLEDAYRLPFPQLLEQLEALTGMDILLLSCYEDEAIHSRMDRLIQAGNRVTLHLLDAPKGGSL